MGKVLETDAIRDKVELMVSKNLKQRPYGAGVKIGRNDKCHCGSDVKYKKCCMDIDNKDEKEKRQEHFDGIKAEKKKAVDEILLMMHGGPDFTEAKAVEEANAVSK